MPPKSSNKKFAPASFWYHCELCDAHICAKDRDTHEKVCPIESDAFESVNGPLEYVRNGEIYTCCLEQRTFAVDDLNSMPQRYTQQIMFISEGAMNLAKFHIGQEIVIRSTSKPDLIPIVRIVWPIPERLLTSIFVNEEDYQLYWLPFKGSTLKISRLPKGYAEPARIINLELLEIEGEHPKLSESRIHELERFLALELKHFIFTRGSSIITNFFNKIHKYKVISWIPLDVETLPRAIVAEELANALENLDFNEKEHFFKVTVGTRMEITCAWQQAAEEDQLVGEKITNIHIGGLAGQLKLVEETMDVALGLRTIPRG